MIDINLKYQASVFANLKDIKPTPENTMKIIPLFREYFLLPGTFQEINPTISPMPVVRLRFSSPDNEWNVNIASQRIDVEKNPTDGSGENMGNIKNFIKTACSLFEVFLGEFNKKGTRISLVTNSILNEMSLENLNAMYDKLAKPLDYYKSNIPFEWGIRTVARESFNVCGSTELVNIVTDISRVKGDVVQNNAIVNFERIKVGFDINTVAENEDARFDISSIIDFYEHSISTLDTILSDVERRIKHE